MKICFVSPGAYVFFNPKSTSLVGGAEKQMYMIGRFLSEQKNKIVSFCVADFGQPQTETFGSITTFKTFRYEQNKLSGFFKLLSGLKLSGADCFVFRGANTGSALAIFVLKTIFKRRRIVYMMANTDEPVPRRLAKMVGRLPALLIGLSFKMVDDIIVQTAEQADLLSSFRGLTPKAVIRNMVTLPASYGQVRDTVLWVGRAVKWKRPEIFLDLASKFKGYRFVMICTPNFDLDFYDKIKSDAAEIPNLEFIGSVAPDLIENYFSKAFLYTITSISEGFPNTMLEAFSHSVPILSLGIDPDGVVVKHGLGHVANSVDDYYAGFDQLVGDPSMLKEASERAFQYVSDFHSESAVGVEIGRLFNEF